MKRISIFGKEFYIFNDEEHYEALNAYCGIESGLSKSVNVEWIEEHVLSKGHVIDSNDLYAIRSILSGMDFAKKYLNPLKKAIGWD